MKLRYANHQDKLDPMHGREIASPAELADLLEARRRKVPFVASLAGDNGYKLSFGMGCGVGSAQYSKASGDPPYLVAVPSQRRVKSNAWFLMGGTPSEIPSRHVLNFEEVKQIALHFLETGERSPAFRWEEV